MKLEASMNYFGNSKVENSLHQPVQKGLQENKETK